MMAVSYFFVLIITLMLLRIFSGALMSISNTHNYKTFTKVLLHVCYIASKTFGIIHLASVMVL